MLNRTSNPHEKPPRERSGSGSIRAVTPLIAVVLGLAACDRLMTTAPESGDIFDGPLAGLSAADLAAFADGLEWNGEAAVVEVEIPPSLVSIFASRQGGFFVETRRVFGERWIRTMPLASFSAALRAEGVDFDRDLAGDSRVQLTGGLHFRPTSSTVFKFDYARGRNRDRFNNAFELAALKFSLTSYF